MSTAMTFDEVKQYMSGMGWGVYSKSGDRGQIIFDKQVFNDVIYAKVNIFKQTCGLSYVTQDMLELKTGDFQLTHPKFKTWFEDRIVRYASAIKRERGEL